MRWFPMQYAAWKMRMMANVIRERQEYLALAGVMGVVAALGTLALWVYGSRGLTRMLSSSSFSEVERTATLLAFSAYVAYGFMALANVITRFFGPERMEERERLKGPLSGTTLFLTELFDVCRLPMGVLVVAILVPLTLTAWALELPFWVSVLAAIDLVLLYLQPTLLVMALYIATLRFIPGNLLNRQGLLFGFFFLIATLGASALGAIRKVYHGTAEWSAALPSTWAALIIPSYQHGQVDQVLTLSGRLAGMTLLLLAVTFVLYRFFFIERLEDFGLQLAHGERAGRRAPLERWLQTRLLRRHSPPVVAIVLKDLRSSRRDTAQRVAFTALAAVTFALVLVDLLFDRQVAMVFLPIFFFYALFLVSCQGLSTFSAEGGVLENLARFPLEAGDILKAKIISHFLLFCVVIGITLGLAAIAPGRLPFWIKGPLALLGGVVLVPLAWFLAWITVTLGAVFPKPGEGGGRKEISIFAMGLFFQLTTLVVLSLGLALLAPFSFGFGYVVAPLAVGVAWWAALRFLYRMANRAINRALGAEMRAG